MTTFAGELPGVIPKNRTADLNTLLFLIYKDLTLHTSNNKITDNEFHPERLFEAARKGDFIRCHSLLSGHSNIRERINDKHCGHYDNGTTALVIAVKYSNSSMYPPDPRKQFESVIALLLQYGADVSVVCIDGKTALHWAIKRAAPIKIMQLLLERLPKDKIDTEVDGSTALMTAIKCTSRKLWKGQVSALLEHGADPHTVDKKGNSLLHQSSKTGEWLVKNFKHYNMNINRKNENGATPLITAILQKKCLQTKYWSRSFRRICGNTSTTRC